MATKTARKVTRSAASGSLRDLETVAHVPDEEARWRRKMLGKEVTIKETDDKRRKKREEASGKVASALTTDRFKTAAKHAPKMTQAEQSAEFKKVAREHGAEGSEAEFNGVLRSLTKPKR